MPSNAIEIDQLWKLFRRQKQRTFKEMLPSLLGSGKKGVIDSFWALEDVSFQVKKGETFGIVGPNGSGKSTLLKILAGVTLATKGKFVLGGKIAPLIELGAGFHPEMTGRENIFLNSIILGSTREETKPKVQSIIDFSEIEDFIDTPVKHYSSGMYMRLAFAVAIHTNFDILLVDEILAVGDEKFQKKCYAKMQEFKEEGKTIVLVSHNLKTVESFCDRAAYLKYGHLVACADSKLVAKRYAQDIE
ncbi:Teichoic acids export ATP-binding protein TagH [bioreactor metagenome]|uniref:Teichoic acids export ATP-binding protein TagH n=1 Tax=bioreactor metagenome TaxID=1076179 RepID=A0A645AB64_9ZZZZ